VFIGTDKGDPVTFHSNRFGLRLPFVNEKNIGLLGAWQVAELFDRLGRLAPAENLLVRPGLFVLEGPARQRRIRRHLEGHSSDRFQRGKRPLKRNAFT
jgi:hypothetical protein